MKFHGLKMFEATFCHLLPMYGPEGHHPGLRVHGRPSPTWQPGAAATRPADWLYVLPVYTIYIIYN